MTKLLVLVSMILISMNILAVGEPAYMKNFKCEGTYSVMVNQRWETEKLEMTKLYLGALSKYGYENDDVAMYIILYKDLTVQTNFTVGPDFTKGTLQNGTFEPGKELSLKHVDGNTFYSFTCNSK